MTYCPRSLPWSLVPDPFQGIGEGGTLVSGHKELSRGRGSCPVTGPVPNPVHGPLYRRVGGTLSLSSILSCTGYPLPSQREDHAQNLEQDQ